MEDFFGAVSAVASTNFSSPVSNVTLSGFCLEASSKSDFSLAVGALLTVGACLSYFPQHVAIIRTKSVEGLSWPWLFLGCVSSFSLLINVICLRWEDIRCCEGLAANRCQIIFLPVYQVGVGILNTLPLFAAYVYLRVDGSDKGAVPGVVRRLFQKCGANNTDKWARNGLLFFLLLYFTPISLTCGLLLGLQGTSVSSVSFGAALGGVSSITSILMWLPQIVYTIRNRDGGSLSLVMLCIQMPGNLAAVYFQGIVEQEGITTYGPYLASALQQFLLIFIIIFFRFRSYRKRKKESMAALSATEEEAWTSDADSDSDLERSQLLGKKTIDDFVDKFVDGI